MRTVQGYEECGWRERTQTVGTWTDGLTTGLRVEDQDNIALYTAQESEVQGTLSPISGETSSVVCVTAPGPKCGVRDSEAATVY